jgi:hypothetical protein
VLRGRPFSVFHKLKKQIDQGMVQVAELLASTRFGVQSRVSPELQNKTRWCLSQEVCDTIEMVSPWLNCELQNTEKIHFCTKLRFLSKCDWGLVSELIKGKLES